MIDTQTIPLKSVIRRILLIFAIASLITAFILNLMVGDQKLSETVQTSGGTIGPILVEKDNTIIQVRVGQNLPKNSWSNVSIGLLDNQKRYLTGFGEGLWDEDGYDSDGYYWHESEETYKARLTIPQSGEYYLKITPESNLSEAQKRRGSIAVHVTTPGFSPIPHLAGGIIALVIWLVTGFIGFGRSPLEMLREH